MAGGYYTAPFDDANVLTIDAIGEFETITIWDNTKKIYSKRYPYSIGLLQAYVLHNSTNNKRFQFFSVEKKICGYRKWNFRIGICKYPKRK